MPEIKYTISNEEKKYFMCNKCFKTIKGKYNSSISFFSRDIIGLSNIKIYNDTENSISIKCPYCNDDDADMFEIDEYMIDPVRALNEKGYYTKFCCEGHIYPIYIEDDRIYDAVTNRTIDSVVPYIWFDWYKIAEEKKEKFYQMEKDGYPQKGFNSTYYIDQPFFYYEFGRDYTLFKSEGSDQIGLIDPPEGWIEDINESKINSIYYKGKDIGLDEDSNILYEVDEILSKINEPEDDFDKRMWNVIRAKKYFSRENKDKIFGELMKWIESLPDLKNINTKKDLFETFNL
jgi:hypothetical protein